MLQFAHVARPGPLLQPVSRRLSQNDPRQPHPQAAARRNSPPAAPRHFPARVAARTDNRKTLSRWYRSAPSAFHHLLAQIAVRRRQHPHIDPQAAVIADALNIAILQHAQQVWPATQRQFADFVKETGLPLSAISNLPLRLLIAPVNAPFTWPNSSLSATLSGSAAQLRYTRGLAARGDPDAPPSPPALCRCRFRR